MKIQILKPSKKRILLYKKKSKRLIRLGLNWAFLVLMLTSFTSFSQTDTTKTRKDSITVWLPYIVKDLKDYDLVKQKSYYQDQKIKGLEAITNAQKNLSIRQNISLESYVNFNIKLQTTNKNLQADIKLSRKKLIKSRLENWFWRASSVAGIYFLFLR